MSQPSFLHGYSQRSYIRWAMRLAELSITNVTKSKTSSQKQLVAEQPVKTIALKKSYSL